MQPAFPRFRYLGMASKSSRLPIAVGCRQSSQVDSPNLSQRTGLDPARRTRVCEVRQTTPRFSLTMGRLPKLIGDVGCFLDEKRRVLLGYGVVVDDWLREGAADDPDGREAQKQKPPRQDRRRHRKYRWLRGVATHDFCGWSRAWSRGLRRRSGHQIVQQGQQCSFNPRHDKGESRDILCTRSAHAASPTALNCCGFGPILHGSCMIGYRKSHHNSGRKITKGTRPS